MKASYLSSPDIEIMDAEFRSKGRSGSKFRSGPAFWGARIGTAGLMLGSREAIKMCFSLAKILVWCLEDGGRM